jgi:hypothetical protein
VKAMGKATETETEKARVRAWVSARVTATVVA